MTNVEIVKAALSKGELLAQLAEEAAELAQAALKLRRTLSNANPTPVTMEEAYDNLMEELADIGNCLDALGYDEKDMALVEQKKPAKMERWAGRLIE